MTSLSATLSLELVYLRCSKSVVLALSNSMVFPLTSRCFFSLMLCISIPPLNAHPWPRALLSVPRSHTRTQWDAYPNTAPLMAHLTPETREPGEGQMVDAGRGLVCGLAPVRGRLRTSNINRECGASRRRGLSAAARPGPRLGIPFPSALCAVI